jgi:nitroimidazol reductase NimA-like FMN-containing flavoprotein (pyridoxamine 5'-phosphate oxidase superfamily)
MAAIPPEYLDLLQQKTTFAHLATIMPDGTPQVTPVWFDYTNGKIRVNSAKGRVKTRNMTEGAPVGSGANGRIWPAMMSAELPEGWA